MARMRERLSRALDSVVARRWVVAAAVFMTLSAARLSALVSTLPGYDGMLYREATLRWLAGGDPWAIPANGAVFGAPPPTLLAMLPFAVLPEPLARVTLVALGVAASIWLLRRLRLPIWWLAFPPLVDGLYIANPQVFVVPLLLAGAGPIATFVKVYAAVPALILFRWRTLLVSAAIIAVTIPFLPWGLFLERWPAVNAALASQSAGGGLSAMADPWLLPVAFLGAVALGRRAAAWWAVPVFWPFTQWYYSAMILPVATPIAAIALSMPVRGATTVAIVVAAVEVWLARREGRAVDRLVGEAPAPVPLAARPEPLGRAA
jgi:hypothetical protein